MRALALALAGAALLAGASEAIAQKERAATPLLPGGDAHAPVSVNADKLEYFNKEQKAVYSGHVFARQGDGSLRSSTLTIFFVGANQGAPGTAAGAGAPGGSQVTRMEAAGPVTIVQKDQVGVGDSATYQRAANEVILIGNVSLTQGPDVVKGDRLVYDLKTGQAQVLGRVSSLFIPGNSGPGASETKSPRPSRKKARTVPAKDAPF
jgi:lipopolysaccharide export system protein LptA